MSYKKLFVLLFLTACYCEAISQATPPPEATEVVQDTVEQETPSSVPAGNEPLSGPRYYRSIIKPNAITRKGLFVVHKVDDNYYFEIPDTLLGRDLLVVSRIARGAAGIRPGYSGYAGDQIGTTVIRFEKGPNHNLFLRRISFADNMGDSTNVMFRAVVRSNLQPLAASFTISAYTPNRKGSVIEVTNYINGDNDILFFSPGVKQQMRVGSMLTNMCYIKDVQPFPLNVEIRTIKTYDQASSSGSSFTWELNTSIMLLPSVPMKKRFADRRVGYFTERYTDYSANPQGVEVVSYIKRWRLEPRKEDLKKYFNGELVEPAKPIVLYIDPATPKKWIPYLIQGINDWQQAFEQAGFKNAIVGKEAPTPEEDPGWSLEDTRYSVVVYKPSSVANATGPIITDPRSGEILESHINWHHNLMSLLRTWYMVQCGPNDPRARQMNFDDELMGSLIRSVASHEVGHALGLIHNLGASSSTPVAKLRDREWLKHNGHCASIMDYARFNYVAQPEDSVDVSGLLSRIGPYDRWAIEWGYRILPDTVTEEKEKAALSAWSTSRLKDSRLWFGSEFGTDDPRSQAEDLGDNAMLAGTYGIQNLQRVVPHLLHWTRQEHEGYGGMGEVYSAVTSQYENYLNHVTKNIGGVYTNTKTSDQQGSVYKPVPAYLQQEAIRFLDQQIFTTPYWLADTTVLTRIGSTSLQIVGRIQGRILNDLINLNKLSDLVYAQSMYGESAYNLVTFFDDLENSILKELMEHQPVDQFRRTLQRHYVEKMIVLLNPNTPGKGYHDVIPIVKKRLRDIRSMLRVAMEQTEDYITTIHFQYLYEELNAVLPPEEVKRTFWQRLKSN